MSYSVIIIIFKLIYITKRCDRNKYYQLRSEVISNKGYFTLLEVSELKLNHKTQFIVTHKTPPLRGVLSPQQVIYLV